MNSIKITDTTSLGNELTMVSSELAKLTAQVEAWNKKEKEAVDLGKELATKITDIGDFSTLYASIACSSFLDAVAQCEPDRECIELLLKWTFENFWALEVERHLPLFDEYWEWLDINNARKGNPLTWGDIDCSAWIET